MPWRWAISNNSTIAHSTTSGLGSAGCRILFIGHLFISVMHFCEAKPHIYPSDFLRFSLDPLPLSVQNCTLSLIIDLAGWISRDGDGCSGLYSSALFLALVAIAPGLLRTATQERQGALRVCHELALFMMVAVVLQIPQTTVNCRFRRIHALNQLLRIQLDNGSGA